MKIFIICTVRTATQEYLNKLYKYVEEKEAEGHTVYLPPRDTNQEDFITGGYIISTTHRNVIKDSDEVHISYNEFSTGTHFDLGMTFAFNKKIHVFDCPEVDYTIPKSYPKMLKYWESLM